MSLISRTWRRFRGGLAAVPLFGLLAVFFFAPLVSTFWESFYGLSFDFSKYAAVFSEPTNFRILAHTLAVGLAVTAASVIVGYPVAYHLTRLRPRLFTLVTAVVLVPLFTAFLIRTYAWIVILGRQGIVNNALVWLGVIQEPLTILNTTTAVVIGMTHVFVPMAIFTIYAGMVRIDDAYVRAALILGANPVKSFVRVYFPMTLPSVLSAAVLIFIVAIGFYITPSLLGGPADTMISQLVVVQMTTLLDFEMGYALSVVLLVATLAIILLAGLVVPLELIWSAAAAAPRKATGGKAHTAFRRITRAMLSTVEDVVFCVIRPFLTANIPWLTIYTAAVLAFLAAPLLVVCILSFSSSPFVIFPPPGFSLQWWEKLYLAQDWHAALLASLKLGLATAVGSTVVGTMGAFWLVRAAVPAKRLLYLLTLAPLIVPVIVTATSLYVFEARLRLLGTFPGLLIGHMLLATPYVVVIMSSALRGLDRTLEQAAAINGARMSQTLRWVTLPLLAPALVTAGLLAFLTSFDELLVSIFLLGRQTPTLPIKFWGDIKYQIDPMLSTASTLIVVMIIIAVLLAQWFRLRQERRNSHPTGG
ncbi:MAG: ABC transporter permease subunit [Parvibaculaceae bacterium]